MLYPHHAELILELEDTGSSISGPRECSNGRFESPWGNDVDRGRLNLVESKIRHGETVLSDDFGAAVVVDDVSMEQTPTGDDIREARITEEISLLKRHTAAALLEEAKGLCRGGSIRSDCD